MNEKVDLAFAQMVEAKERLGQLSEDATLRCFLEGSTEHDLNEFLKFIQSVNEVLEHYKGPRMGRALIVELE